MVPAAENRVDNDFLDRDHHTRDFLKDTPITHLDSVMETAVGEKTCPS